MTISFFTSPGKSAAVIVNSALKTATSRTASEEPLPVFPMFVHMLTHAIRARLFVCVVADFVLLFTYDLSLCFMQLAHTILGPRTSEGTWYDKWLVHCMSMTRVPRANISFVW